MQYVQRFSLNPSKWGECRQWFSDNAVLLAKEAPEGWTYLGTWFTVRGLGRYDCEVRWELTDYSALPSFGTDAFEAAVVAALLEFINSSIPIETTLMKSSTDVRLPTSL